MSSMTIDQLKKSLTEQGVTLPPPRSKKADYLKLYKQYSTINDSLGDVYSSDDENPPRTGSQSVTSSSSPSKADSIVREVTQLSDDDLYHRLKEYDDKIGPVLKNTRRVYEKKLIKILAGGGQTNGYESGKRTTEKFAPSVDEFSDSDVEVITRSAKTESKGRSSMLRDSPNPSYSVFPKPDSYSSNFEFSNQSTSPGHKNEIKSSSKFSFMESKGRSSVLRDSPNPSFSPFPKSESYSSNFEFNNQSSSPGDKNEIKSSKFSYIETIPKGSTFSYIEPDTEVDFPGNTDVRQRFTEKYDANKYSTNRSSTDDVYKPTIGMDSYKSRFSSSFKPGLGSGDYKSGLASGSSTSQYKPSLGMSSQYKSGGGFGESYSGTWEPNISRYLNTGVQQKKVASNATGQGFGSWFKKFLAALLLFAMILLVIYICHQWSSTDPYKVIEDDAERKIQELSEGSGGFK